MPRPMRSAARTTFAAAQVVLLGTALLGLRSPLEILLGVVVLGLLLLNPALFQQGRRKAPPAGPRPSPPERLSAPPSTLAAVPAASRESSAAGTPGIRAPRASRMELVAATASRS